MRDLAARIGSVIAIDLAVALAAFTGFDDTVQSWQAGARYTGRISLVIFTLMLVDNTWPQLRSARVLGERPFSLLAFHHAIHLGFLLTYLVLADRVPPIVRLLGGMLGYAMVFVMPVLHTRWQRGALSARAWRGSRVVYFSYLWFVMLMTYVARVFSSDLPFGGERSHYLGLLSLVIALGVACGAVALLTTMGILRRHDDSV